MIVILVATVIAQSSAEEKWIWSKETKTGTIQSDTTKISVAKPILNDAQLGSRRKIDDEQSRFLMYVTNQNISSIMITAIVIKRSDQATKHGANCRPERPKFSL